MTEEFRLIKRSILNCRGNGTRPRSILILITSALPEEGKTYTAIDLAMSMAAEENTSVPPIDANWSWSWPNKRVQVRS